MVVRRSPKPLIGVRFPGQVPFWRHFKQVLAGRGVKAGARASGARGETRAGSNPAAPTMHLGNFVGLPVRTTLLQNSSRIPGARVGVGLPVRTTLLQNISRGIGATTSVGLPVRTTLLQNLPVEDRTEYVLDYQSERHCSKTKTRRLRNSERLDYQSERHCSKTKCVQREEARELDYQSERHCSKTYVIAAPPNSRLDYQSERHCSKTTRGI